MKTPILDFNPKEEFEKVARILEEICISTAVVGPIQSDDFDLAMMLREILTEHGVKSVYSSEEIEEHRTEHQERRNKEISHD